MADQDYGVKSIIQQVAVGVDESTQSLEPGPEWDSVSGLFPALFEVHALNERDNQLPNQGGLQRLSGKKLIDANPQQSVYAICQAFNGFGQFGYYVQTNQKLYFHTCEAPKDLHCSFATLQTLGTDEQGLSLNIFGQQPSTTTIVPDNSISCLFDFPTGDKPTPPNAGHPGVDYLLIQINPTSSADNRLRTRLTAINTTTSYDNQDVGYYKTQNACRQDSVPLVDGPDGSYGYPPTNVKLAFLGWGGDVLVNTWTLSQTGPVPPTPASWGQVSPPAKNQTYADDFIHVTVGNAPNTDIHGNKFYVGVGFVVGQRAYDANGRTIWLCTSIGTAQLAGGATQPNAQFVSVVALGYGIDYSTRPTTAAEGQHAVDGNIIYIREGGVWIKPYTLAFTATWTYATEAARQAATGFTQNQVGKYAKVTGDGAWYKLLAIDKPGVPVNVTWNYNNTHDREVAIGFITTDIGKIAHQLDNDTYWILTDFNRHNDKTNLLEYYLINLNRLFTDYQSLAPVSLQFMIRAYWDKAHGGSGNVFVDVKSYKGGLLTRFDKVAWGVDANSVLINQQTTTKTATLLSIDNDAKGNNLVLITVTMSNGVITLTTPTVNGDGASLCPF